MKARLPLLLGMAALLLIAVVASRGSSAVHPGDRALLPVPKNPPPPVDQPPAEDLNPVASTIAAIGFAGLMLVFGALLLFGLAVIITGVFTARRRKARLSSPVIEREKPETDSKVDNAAIGQHLRSAVERARTELVERRSGPPSDAVVAAWMRLEQAAAESGFARRPHETPTEFTTGVLAGQLGDEPAVPRLRELYQRARFGRADAVTEADADAATAALAAILRAVDARQVAR